MSLIIKGMQLPRKSEHRECSIAVVQNRPVSIAFSRTKNNPFECFECAELPTPHGRLIDADELKKNMRNYYPSIDHLCCSQHVVTKRDIDCAPTIIGAEVSE